MIRLVSLCIALVGVCVDRTMAQATVTAVGKFLHNASDSPKRMDEKVTKTYGGFQTSGLTFDGRGALWSIGDQNATEANKKKLPSLNGYGYRIALGKRLGAHADWISWESAKSQHGYVKKKQDDDGGLPWLDFEGIASVPNTRELVAVIEGAPKFLVRMAIQDRKVLVNHAVALHTKEILKGEGVNRGFEGIAVTPNGESVILSFANKPRGLLFSVPYRDFAAAELEKGVKPAAIGIELQLKRARGEEALSGLCFFQHKNVSYLAALQRNSSCIHLLRYADGNFAFDRRVDLDLRAPSPDGKGFRIGGASPEGIACDGSRIVIVGDPYRPVYKTINGERVKELDFLQPLVFEFEVSELFE